MKALAIVGIVLIAIGIVALVAQGITYTKHEKVLDIGPLQATAKEKETIPLPPVLGALSLAAGVVLLIVGARKP
jgi:uncharacterized membrane protein HdeD (DUF308 family)